MRFLLCALLGLLCAYPAFGQVSWQKRFGGPGNDIGYDVLESSSGDLYLIGSERSFNSSKDATILKINSFSGELIWNRSFGATQTDEEFHSLNELSDGTLVTVGCNPCNGNPTKGAWSRFSSNGNLLQQKTYSANNLALLNSSISLPNQQTLSTGFTSGGFFDLIVLQTDSLGNATRKGRIGLPNSIENIAGGKLSLQTHSGDLVIAGTTTYPTTSGSNLFISSLSPSDSILWARVFSLPEQPDLKPTLLQEIPDGFLLIGSTDFSGSFGLFVTWLDSAGNETKTRIYDRSGVDFAWDAEVMDNGNIFIAGTTGDGHQGSEDGFLLSLNPEGDTLWGYAYGGQGQEIFQALSPASDGGFFLTGSSSSFASGTFNRDIYLVKTDSLGNSYCNQLPISFTVTDTHLTSVNVPAVFTTEGSMTPSALISTQPSLNDSLLCQLVPCTHAVKLSDLHLPACGQDSGYFSHDAHFADSTAWFIDNQFSGNGLDIHQHFQPGGHQVMAQIFWEGCLRVIDTSFSYSQLPQAGFSQHSSVPGSPVTFQASASTPGLSFAWDLGDGNTSTQSTFSHTFAPGSWQTCLTVTDSLGCQDSSCQSITVLVGIAETEWAGLRIWPQVTQNEFYAEGLPEGETTWMLWGINGELLGQGSLQATNVLPPHLASGLYVLELRRAESSIRQKILIQP